MAAILLFVLWPLLSALPGTSHLPSEPSPSLSILGSYRGTVFDSGRLTKITTTFSLGPDGRLQGTFVYEGPMGPIEGNMGNLRWKSRRTLTGHWEDIHGRGNFQFQFNERSKAFEGHWGPDQDLPLFPWTGRRLEPEAPPQKTP
ncbi:MAG: hypothetical protein AAF191_12795 [Verrucomicrobiota bacterium]